MTNDAINDELQAILVAERGMTLLQLNRAPEAVPILQDALRLSPESSGLLACLALALHYAGRPKEALENARRAVALGPEETVTYSALSTVLLWQNGSGDESLQAAQAMVRLAPDDSEAALTLAQVLELRGDLTSAQSEALRARDLDPGNANSHAVLASIATKAEKWTNVERHTDNALALNPQSADAFFNSGEAYSKQGRSKEASVAYFCALELDPQYDTYREKFQISVQNLLEPKNRPLCCIFMLVYIAWVTILLDQLHSATIWILTASFAATVVSLFILLNVLLAHPAQCSLFTPPKEDDDVIPPRMFLVLETVWRRERAWIAITNTILTGIYCSLPVLFLTPVIVWILHLFGIPHR